MIAPRVAASFALVGLGLSASCSAVIGDYDLVDCSPDDEPCEKLNRELKGQCYRYQCSAGGYGCVLRESDGTEDGKLNEICDGLDNDCDDFIDEGVKSNEAPDEIPTESTAEQASYATPANGDLYLALTHRAARWETILLNASTQALEPLESTPNGCEGPLGSRADCSVNDVSFVSTEQLALAAGVHRSGCARGQLRVAIAATPSELDFGAAAEEHQAFGIAVDTESSCTQSSECLGAEKPAVTVFEVAGEAREGLVVWQAAVGSSSCSERCSCEPSNQFHIEGLGLRIQAGSNGPTVTPQSTSGQPLDSRVANGAAAAVAYGGLGESGYLVAYPSEDGVELLRIPLFADAERLDSETFARIEASGASDLALCIGSDPVVLRGLAVAFRVAGDDGHGIRVASTALDRADPQAMRVVAVETEGRVLAGPSIAYVPDGFMTPEAGDLRGGWLVTWVEEGVDKPRLMAARIAEANAELRGGSIELVTGLVTEPFTYLKHEMSGPPSLRYGFLAGDTLHLNQLTCEIAD